MEDSNYENSAGDVTSALAMSRIEEKEFLSYLEHHDPKYVSIYKMFKEGGTTTYIASMLKVSDRMIRNYRNEIKELYDQFESE